MSRPWSATIVVASLCATEACSSSTVATDAATADSSPVPDATLACTPVGAWTWHRHVSACASDPSDVAIVIEVIGPGALRVTVGAERLVGAFHGSSVSISDPSGSGIPAGLNFEGTLAPDCARMAGTFGGECVTGVWSAERR